MLTRILTSLYIYFTGYSDGVARNFVGCRDCHRVISYYRIVGKKGRTNCPYCGCGTFKTLIIPEWQAATRVLWALIWRKGILKRKKDWDPRVPIRMETSRYA